MIFTKVYRTIIINSQTKHKNGKEHKEDVTHLEFMQKDEERSNSTASKCEELFKPFADKLNSLLASQTSKKFSTENIYCVNLTSSSTSNASRINKLLKRREEELYKQEDMLILCPIKTATPIRIFQPKKSNFTIVLASQSEFDCSELNPKELNPSRPNYGKLNLCELILTDFKFDTYEKENNGASSDRDIKFKNAKTKSDSVILYKENDDGKDDKNKTKGACFTSIRQSSDEIEYKLEDGVVKMSHFKLPSSKDEYLNFNLLNFAKENNFTLRDDKDSAMFDMKLRLALGNNAEPTSTSSSSLALTLDNLIIENEKGEASDIDKVYLHHCGDKSIYESSSLVKNKDSDMKNSYRATFNIPIDRNDKKDTKLIVYSSDLSKIYDTKSIHAYTGTAIISIGYKDKSGASFSYTNKVSLRDITDHIVNVVSDNEYPFKTNEEISLKAIYKQEKGDKRYKEVLWGYKVIKSIEYNEVSKSNPKDVVELKDKKGKEIRFKISDLIKKDDLDKLKQGGHTIVFFAYLEGEKDKFKYQSVYGKNHIRIDIKIPLYIKFKDDKLIIYEFEHAIKEKSFKANINFDSSLTDRDKNIKDGYYYINKNINQAQEVKIYEDENLNKTLNVKDEKNRQTLNNVYGIYVNENSANSQILDSIISKDKKYGINLLSKDNMNSFINSFNESKSITRVDSGMWVDGDREVGVKAEIELCNCEKLYADKFKVTKLYESYGPIYRGKISLKNYTYWDDLITSNQVTEDEKNILIAMSENEGNLDAVQSYDSEVLSAGAMQKTVKSTGRGEFSKQLAKFRDKHPKLYITHAMNCGWKVVGKDSDATIYYSNSLLTYGNDITGEELKAIIRKDCNVKNYGKSTYNKPLAAIVKLISLKEFQELQVLDFIDRLHEAENKKLIINGKNFAIKDFVTTKFGRALILDQSVNRPNNVSTNFKTALDNFFADHPKVNKDPTTWKTNHVMYENTLLEYYRDARVQMTDNIKRFNNLKDKLYENN